ncbi:MAG: non-homologous end-joining DNA ligase [Acidimicrobiia bacterium]|nr:non-homologous end-joining DNA ligase [Acidimicrobiia bacterium]
MKVSSADRIMFPEVGLTKGDMVGYYETIADLIFPFLVARPLTLERYPQGIGTKGFMQKNAADHFPDSIERYEVPKSDGGTTTFPVITEPTDVPYLANQGTVSFHIWTSRVPDTDHPDYFVMDLDPEAGDVGKARSAAEAARDALASFGVESIPVATGSKGYHVWAPIVPDVAWQEVAIAAQSIAGLVVAANPDLATTEFLKKNRKGRVFVDWMRNHPGASVVSPFSIRPRPTAPVSTPITWDELAITDPDQWTVANLAERVASLPAWPKPSVLPAAEMEAAARSVGVDLDTRVDRFGRES